MKAAVLVLTWCITLAGMRWKHPAQDTSTLGGFGWADYTDFVRVGLDYVASNSYRNTIEFFNSSNQRIGEISATEIQAQTGMSFSGGQDGPWTLAATADGTVYFSAWDDISAQDAILKYEAGQLTVIAMLPIWGYGGSWPGHRAFKIFGGRLYISTPNNGSDIAEIAVPGGFIVRQMTLGLGTIRDVAFTPQGQMILATANGNLFRVDDPAAGTWVPVAFGSLGQTVRAVDYSGGWRGQDGLFVLLGNGDVVFVARDQVDGVQPVSPVLVAQLPAASSLRFDTPGSSDMLLATDETLTILHATLTQPGGGSPSPGGNTPAGNSTPSGGAGSGGGGHRKVCGLLGMEVLVLAGILKFVRRRRRMGGGSLGMTVSGR